MKKSKNKRFPSCEKIDCLNIIESARTCEHVCRALYDNDFKRADGSTYDCPFYKKAGETKK